MASFELDRKSGAFVIRGRIDPDMFRSSESGKSTLLLSGAGTQITGDAGVRGSLNLYVKDVSTLGIEVASE